MPTGAPEFVTYPALERHGLIGDRRTCALVAADGTIDWLCLPSFDGVPVLGVLLDACRGGFFRLGPATRVFGEQRYAADTAVLSTRWALPDAELELLDAMIGPEDDRSPGSEGARVVVRRLRCLRGAVPCTLEALLRPDFAEAPPLDPDRGVHLEGIGQCALSTSVPVERSRGGLRAHLSLRAGEEIWAVLESNAPPRGEPWSAARVARAFADVRTYWRQWSRGLDCGPQRAAFVRRSAITVHLLSYAPQGSVVAAATTSLPERIGGSWNADYRLSWLRDASLSSAMLAQLGDVKTAARYLDWLAHRDSTTEAPLQVLYRIDGSTRADPRERDDLFGYRGSRPVRYGNHAYRQRQLDSLGYVAECAKVFVEHGGRWRDEYTSLLDRVAEHVAGSWDGAGNGVWELDTRQHFVSSRVMSWVALDATLGCVQRTGRTHGASEWASARSAIFAQVLERGWSDRLGAFRQRYEGENLDAAALVIPVMGFLPADDPRVVATAEQIARHLTIDGWVYRFHPEDVPGTDPIPFGEFEGAFVLCSLWLATTYAKMGRLAEAEAILDRVEALAGPLGLFPEGVDARSGTWLGNFPLLFTHVEYVRAVRAIASNRGKA